MSATRGAEQSAVSTAAASVSAERGNRRAMARRMPRPSHAASEPRLAEAAAAATHPITVKIPSAP
ncbi:MAG: hypothetical protein IJR55_07615 [Clostridia bacterium]|nr:hypothetical protein [Clostridia bacterium]